MEEYTRNYDAIITSVTYFLFVHAAANAKPKTQNNIKILLFWAKDMCGEETGNLKEKINKLISKEAFRRF